MAASNLLPPYNPTGKPSKPFSFAAAFAATFSPFKRTTNFCSVAFIFSLCFLCYLLGVYKHGGLPVGPTFSAAPAATTTIISLPCSSSSTNKTTTKHSSTKALDFSSHHGSDPGYHPTRPVLEKYPLCDIRYSEYTPCEDPQRSLKFKRHRLIYRERHCPRKEELLKCRIPAPFGYKNPFPWPRSRDLAWFANVPHKELTVEKAVQNWIRYEEDKFIFPGGGTMFPNGADAYIDDIGKLINLSDGSIRTAIDTGCGVASWGAYLMSRNIITMSFAPRDSHEAQVQFALERGVPAMIGVIASRRLPYPSRAFDMAHCSRCLIPWHQHEGVYLMEVDRILRPGGYWILSGPPIRWKKYWRGWERTKEDLNEEQNNIEKIAKSLCWKKFIEKDDIAIWQKPFNHFNCKTNLNPPFCPAPDSDKAWYTELKTCLTRLPEVSNGQEVAGGPVAKWPKRLNAVPPRIKTGAVKGVTVEVFKKDSELWRKRLSYYKKLNNQLTIGGRYRNILDMNAYLGGFAAALVNDPVWVMNVIPVQAKVNTLGVVYERGLIGTYHNWCEPMSTYPRTYDFIHADSIFSLYRSRCKTEDILLEMDRILRPEGGVIFRDDVDILIKIKKITDGLNWASQIMDHEDGPLEREKLLLAVKAYETAPKPDQSLFQI